MSQLHFEMPVNSQLVFLSADILISFSLSDMPVNQIGVAKAGEMRDTKLNLSGNIVSLQVLVDVSRFSPCVTNLSPTKNICCGLRKVAAKSRGGYTLSYKVWLCYSFFITVVTCHATNLL